MSVEVDDDVYPAKAVAYIVSTWGSQSYVSSGVLVGRNDVLTASHSIYDPALGKLADDVKIYFSYDPDTTNDSYYSVTNTNYHDDFDPDKDGLIYSGDNNGFTLSGVEKDIALLTLSQAAGDTYGWFDIDYSFTSGLASVLGHPGKYDHNLTHDSAYVSKSFIDNYLDIGLLEINPGNSGGPVYVGSGDNASVVGLVSTGAAAVSVAAHEAWLKDIIVNNDSSIETEAVDVAAPANAIFRFFNEATETHFYTASSPERDSLLAAPNLMTYEGVAFGSASNSGTNLSDLVNVYRFYNQRSATHFYTASEEERANLTNTNLDLVFEGVAYQGYKSDPAGVNNAVALHRFFNESTGAHFYTVSEVEKDSIQTVGNMSYEGIAYYVEAL